MMNPYPGLLTMLLLAAPAAHPATTTTVSIEVELDGGTHSCSGFMLSPRHVVSVAQCFFPPGRGGQPAGPDRVRVRWASNPGAGLRPERVLIHPGYARTPSMDEGRSQASPFDIALLSLPATFSAGTRPFPDRPSKAHMIPLRHHIYWLMNQMQAELGAWLSEVFTQPTQTMECRPKAKAAPAATKMAKPQSKVQGPVPLPVPVPNPRVPSSVAGAANSMQPTHATNPLLHEAIFGGSEVAAQSPLLKSVVRVLNENGLCSGTLISPIHVLTAAHCFNEESTKNPGKTRIRLYRNSREVALEIPAARVRVHHAYQDPSLVNILETPEEASERYVQASATDIALVTLERPVPPPHAPMAMPPFEITLKTGATIHVAGMGRDSFTDETSSGTLNSATMTVAEIGDVWIVETDRNQGPLSGDSGGAALHFDKGGRPYLWGVISMTSADKHAQQVYAAFITPVFKHGGWIYENIQADLFDILDGRLRPKAESARTVPDCP